MISDLSPGDKLSLKGKLFELSKKLKIIEEEKKRQNTFQPEINKSNRSERSGTFLANIQKAEIMRKQKLDLLKANLEMEEACSFKPTITRGIKAVDDDRPAFIRLYEKGKEYELSRLRRLEYEKSFDENGVKLFQPQLLACNLSTSSVNTMSAEDFLYRDAKEREEKVRQSELAAQAQASSSANSVKMTARSRALLMKKGERELHGLFSVLADGPEASLSFQDLQHWVQWLAQKGRLGCQDSGSRLTDLSWMALDVEKRGEVSLSCFLKACLPLYCGGRGLRPAEWVQGDREPVGDRSEAQIQAQEGTTALRHFLSRLMSVLKEMNIEELGSPGKELLSRRRKESAPSSQFAPSINQRSRHLAEQKKKRDESILITNLEKEKEALGTRTHKGRMAPHDLLYGRKELSEMKIQQLREAHERRLREECPFQPRINPQSQSYSQTPVKSPAQEAEEEESPQSSGEDQEGSEYIHLHQNTEQPRFEELDDESEYQVSLSFEDLQSTPPRSHPNLHEISPLAGHPTSSPSSASASPPSKEPVHQRLFRSRPSQLPTPTPEKGLEECTFAPKIQSSQDSLVRSLSGPSYSASYREAKDAEKAVSRMRAAHEAKAKKQKEIDNLGAFDELRYQKLKALSSSGCQPFKSHLDERRQQKEKEKLSKKTKLYVDVKLGPRTAHIAVAEGDDPGQLAEEFCRVYSLDAALVVVLAEVVRKSMLDNGVALAEPPPPPPPAFFSPNTTDDSSSSLSPHPPLSSEQTPVEMSVGSSLDQSLPPPPPPPASLRTNPRREPFSNYPDPLEVDNQVPSRFASLNLTSTREREKTDAGRRELLEDFQYDFSKLNL